jgi:hypothetical protein
VAGCVLNASGDLFVMQSVYRDLAQAIPRQVLF